MTAPFQFCLRMGDNALVLGHRVSEWCGHGPVLEEDIALANTALDLIGQANLWLELAASVEEKGRSADGLAYLRDPHEFRNLLLVERPNGDFGQTLMRQFLFDAWHKPMLGCLAGSSDARVAEIAAKAVKEAHYHLDRSTELVIALGDGTEESHARMQAALDSHWPFTGEFFDSDETDTALADIEVAPAPEDLRAPWEAHVHAALSDATLTIPEGPCLQRGGRIGRHTEHLGHMLATMQVLQRSHPGATW